MHVRPVETVETVEKSKNEPANRVGGQWYLKWVGVHLVAGAIAAQLQAQMIDSALAGNGATRTAVNLLGLVGVFIVIGAQTYALPNPVRRDWLRWLAYALVAQMIILGANTGLSRSLSVQVYAAASLFLNLLLSVIVSGGAAWLVLRRHVRGAALWFVVVLVASLVATTISSLSYMALGVLLQQGAMTLGTVSGVRILISTVVASLVTGGGLWWLVARSEDDKPKRRMDEYLGTA